MGAAPLGTGELSSCCVGPYAAQRAAAAAGARPSHALGSRPGRQRQGAINAQSRRLRAAAASERAGERAGSKCIVSDACAERLGRVKLWWGCSFCSRNKRTARGTRPGLSPEPAKRGWANNAAVERTLRQRVSAMIGGASAATRAVSLGNGLAQSLGNGLPARPAR